MFHRVLASSAAASQPVAPTSAGLAVWTVFAAMLLSGCGGGSDAGATVDISAAIVASADPADFATALPEATDGQMKAQAFSRVKKPTIPTTTAKATTTATTTTAPDALAATLYTGRAFFVDSASGSDGNAGTSAAPWKTLGRAGQQSLAAGDAVLLKCGGVWRESFTLSATNAAAGKATLGAWGSCTTANRPIVSGADVVSNLSWSVAAGVGSGVYSAPWAKPVTTLYWNGVPLVRARYPNYGGIGREFGLIGSIFSDKTIVPNVADATVLGRTSLAGAKAYIRTNPWLVESHDVAGSTPSGAVTLTALAKYAPQAGQGYFIEGKLALLDTAGEWFHDTVAGRLYVWTPSGQSPAGGVLESTARDIGVTVSKVADVRIDKIAFERQAQQGVFVADAPRTAVTEVTVRQAGATGILIDGATTERSGGSSVQRSTIADSGVMGLSINSPAVQVIGNQIEHTGVGAAATGVSAGVYLQSVGGVVRGNRISDSAFAAVVLAHAAGVTVSGNTLVQGCRRFTDCGAIYSGGAPSVAQRTQISSNAISDMVSNSEGAIGGATTLVAGIYLDEESATHDVLNNMVSRVGVGINLHNSANHTVQYNKVWLTELASVRLHNSSTTETVRGNVIQDNELYASSHLIPSVPATTAPAARNVYAQEWVHGSNAALMFAGINPNISRRNVATTMSAPAALRWSLLGGWNHQTIDATGWSAYSTGESVKSLYAARPFLVTAGGVNLVSNGALQNPGNGWVFWSPVPAAGGRTTYGTCGTAGCADFAPGSSSDFLMSSTFRMASAASASLHRVRLRAQGIVPGGALTMAINRDGGDWGQLGFVVMNQPIASSGETVVDVLFNANSADAGRLNMSGLAGKPLRVRDVTIEPVGGYELFAPDRESTLLVNETASPKSIDCASGVLRTCVVSDLSGGAITWPVTLAPNSALVVLSADAKWKPAP